MEPLLQAFLELLKDPFVLLTILLASAYGLFVGAIPGFTATMAVALLVPFTFLLDTKLSIAGIVALTATAIFSGDIPGALIRIPGTPASAAYTADAYELTRKGRGAWVLGISLVASVAGGLFGAAALIVAAPALAKIAFYFTTYEYFWLVVLGLSSAVVVTGANPAKAIVSLLLGLCLSLIGLDEVNGAPRMTFGFDELGGGISFIPAMIGLFGLAEVLRGISRSLTAVAFEPQRREAILIPACRLVAQRFGAFLRSSGIGTLIGILPGAGADIAAWVSYGVSRRLSKNREEYGRGSWEGVSDASAANNAALGGAWIPALVFGIPGDSVTAIVIGILLMKGITPSAKIFTNEVTSKIVASIYVSFIVANILLIPLGYIAIRLGGWMVKVPRRILLPIIFLFCLVGSFSMNASFFDVGVMLVMGILGFFLEARGFSVGPIVLGLVLGPMLEQNFRFSFIKCGGNLTEFVARPIAGILAFCVLALWVGPYLKARIFRRS